MIFFSYALFWLVTLSADIHLQKPEKLGRGKFSGRKILFVESYHEGYEWTDGVILGLRKGLKGSGVELKTVHMDTKRNTAVEYKKKAAAQVKEIVHEYKPDLLIASDDNASKYLVEPYYKDSKLPVVFCGINCDAETYGYPYSNATGMVELDMFDKVYKHLKKYTRGKRIGFISGDSETTDKIFSHYNRTVFKGKLKRYIAKNFDDFKKMYLQAQDEVNMLIFANNAGISGWNPQEAMDFILKKTRIPTGSTAGWLSQYVLITIATNPVEFGRYSANIAMAVLDGVSPSEIPITTNKDMLYTVNMKIAEKLKIVFPLSVLKIAKMVR